MSAFDLYAAYYDLLYQEKDYLNEARYVTSLIRSLIPGARSLLEMGCGTGGHASILSEMGFDVHGFDISPEMIRRAQVHSEACVNRGLELSFREGDIRAYRTNRRFDAVISLFHVMSYQTRNSDLQAAIATARAHLDDGGLFVFDFWYGPAVLCDRPRSVTKRASDAQIQVVRHTTSSIDVNNNCVDVHFDIEITSRSGGERRLVAEDHRMRYLFLPEIEHLLDVGGFNLVAAHKWMTTERPSDSSWYACVVALAR